MTGKAMVIGLRISSGWVARHCLVHSPGGRCNSTGCVVCRGWTWTMGTSFKASLRPCEKCPSSDRKSTRLNSSHQIISYAVFCLKKKKIIQRPLHSELDKNYDPVGLAFLLRP